jgi:hypothetical protein
VNANLLTPHIAQASRPHDSRALASIRDVDHRSGMTYIACDVPEGMQLATWRRATGPRRRHRLRLRTLDPRR